VAWGRRCDLGCESWPDDPKYKTCPACGEPAPRYHNLSPLTMTEAERFRKNALFEEFYETRCIARGISADGPLPDDYVVTEVT
jgi:hypothetical protein